MSDLGHGSDLVALAQVHDADALRVAADETNLADMGAVDHALRCDQHDVIGVANGGDADDQAIALGSTDVAEALAAAALLAITHAGSGGAARLFGFLRRRFAHLLFGFRDFGGFLAGDVRAE